MFYFLGSLQSVEAAAACLGAVGLAVADFVEMRGGSAQTVRVRQSDAGAVTAGYLHLRDSTYPRE